MHPILPDFFLSEKISVFKKKGSKIGKPSSLEHQNHISTIRKSNILLHILGIILTDQLLSDAPPASHISNPVTLLDGGTKNTGPDRRRHQVSARRELLSWLQRLTPDEGKALFDDREQLALRPVLKIVESGGIMFLAHARHLMSRILSHHCDTQFPDDIAFFLETLRSLHRFIHEQKRLLRYALRVASLRGGDDIAEQTQDFNFLVEDIDSALKALEEDVRFLVGEASIREGKIVGWVSKFAALFLPVSLLATILSISGPGYARWAVLGGLGVPFVTVSVYFMFFWKPAYFNSLRS
jgi:hypothetical protein